MTAKQIYQFGPFRLDAGDRLLLCNGCPLALTPKAFDLLVLLVESNGRLLSKDELIHKLWPETFVEEVNLAQNISLIRKVLGAECEGQPLIETVPKRGYRFRVHVTTAAAPDTPNIAAARTSRRKYWFLGAASLVIVLVGILALWMSGKRRVLGGSPAPAVLAVLPFENLGKEQDFLGDGLTEELIARLSRAAPGQLRLIARTSAMHYKGSRKTAGEIGKELGADYLLENSIRRDTGRMRLTVQLVRVSDQTHLWAENFDRDGRELLPFQVEMAEVIEDHLKAHLFGPGTKLVETATKRPIDPEAHELYLRGRFHFNKRTQEGLNKSIQYYQEALVRQPDYALAYAAIADSYNQIAYFSYDLTGLAERKAREYSEKAVSLDDSLPAAHTALGYSNFMWTWNWSAADRSFTRALQLDPGYVLAHHWYGMYLAASGKTDAAVKQLVEAKQLDPLSPSINTALGYMYYFARDYDRAIYLCQVALELNPNYIPAQVVLSWSYAQKKMYSQAITEIKRADQLDRGNPVYLTILGRMYALNGQRSEALNVLRQLDQMEKKNHAPLPATARAIVFAGLGDRDSAIRWLEKVVPGDAHANWLRVDPEWDFLRDDPRFQTIAARVGTASDERRSK
jgi:TolB-like protein/DNA-binding winged helix-turn-helix (wHTH) protein/tetratricopeptide (TPR) repeat protein